MRREGHAAVIVSLCLLAACGRGSSPSPSPGGGAGETITGRERIGWDQSAASAAELATFRYSMYVDGARFELTEVNCGDSEGPAGFACSARLPPMSRGSHSLELAAFLPSGLESTRSAPLRVTVTGIAARHAPALADGEIVTTADGVRLRADILVDGLSEPTAVAVSPGGRAYVGTAAGLIVVDGGAAVGDEQLRDWTVIAVALSPAFERDAQLYVVQTVPLDPVRFRIARFRDVGGRLAERMVILETGPASAEPAAAARVGHDRKLYAAFDDGGSAAASERLSDWSGKVLRTELDGRTPADQAAASPVLFSGLTSPRGFDWTPDGSAIWIADASRDGIERLRVITTSEAQPRRAAQRRTFTLPSGLGAAGVAFYRSDAIGGLSGDLLIGGRDGGYILRVRFDPADRAVPVSTERLLEDRVRTVRALTVSADGAIYFCTDTALVRLSRL